mgnify:CR=1 FL=1
MPKFISTNRSMYTKQSVRKKRLERIKLKPKVKGVPDDVYRNRLGELLACGHLRIIGFQNLENSKEALEPELERRNMNIKISDVQKAELGDAPHIRGYLQSASESDPLYHLKGWFNEDGSIRIELVK